MEGVPGELTAFLLVMYLLPGFLGVVVHDFLAETKRSESFGRFVAALTLSLLSNIVVGLATGKAVEIPEFGDKPELAKIITAFVTWRLVWLTLVAGALGFVVAYVNNRKWLYRALRALGITNRTGRVDVWQDVFNTYRGRWLQLHYKDGRTLIGWPRFYSEYGEARELFLSDAAWRVPAPAAGHAHGAAPAAQEMNVAGPGVYVGNFEEVLGIDVLT